MLKKKSPINILRSNIFQFIQQIHFMFNEKCRQFIEPSLRYIGYKMSPVYKGYVKFIEYTIIMIAMVLYGVSGITFYEFFL